MNSSCLKKIEHFEWNSLSCMDRAILYATEELKKNSLVSFILLRYHFTEYLRKWKKIGRCDWSYYKELLETIGIEIELQECRHNELEDIARKMLDGNSKIVCAVDNFYQEGSNYYGIIHHPHFICISDYSSGAFKAFDEDYTGEFWKKENFSKGIKYIPKEITSKKLKELANTRCLFNGTSDCTFYKITKKENDLDVLAIACDSYLHQLNYMVNNADNEQTFLLGQISTFQSQQEKYHKMYFDIFAKGLNVTDDKVKSDLKKLIKYPEGWCYAESRMKHISSQLRFFEQCDCDSQPISLFVNQLSELLRMFGELELQIAKQVATGKKTEYENAVKIFEQIYAQEIEAYRGAIAQYDCFRKAIHAFCK